MYERGVAMIEEGRREQAVEPIVQAYEILNSQRDLEGHIRNVDQFPRGS